MTPRDKIMGDIFKGLHMVVWDNWDDAFRKAKRKGETDGYAAFLANAWMDYRDTHMPVLLEHRKLT